MTYEEFIGDWLNDNNYIKVMTSGSTGKPKKIKLSKEFMAQSALRTIRFFKINNKFHLHSCISPDFIGGKMMAVRALVADCNLTWETPSNRPLRSFKSNQKIDLLAVVPSQMDFIVENLDSLPKINTIIIGGSPISSVLRNRIVQSGLNAYETYGMTEIASHIALRRISSEDLPFTTLDDIRVEADESSRLIIKFHNREKIVTNDIARLLSPTQFYILGRADNIINSGGKKISPEVLEEKISDEIENSFVIVGKPDEKWGERIVLVIEEQPKNYDKDIILKKCIARMESWQVPKEIIFVKKIPRTSNGKIIRPHSNFDFFSSLL